MPETNERGILTKEARDAIEASLPPYMGDVYEAWLLAQREVTLGWVREKLESLKTPYRGLRAQGFYLYREAALAALGVKP